MKRNIMLALLTLLTGTATAKKLDTDFEYSTEEPVVPGEYTSKFAAAKKLADEQGIPLVAFWASSSCGQCKKLERANMLDDVVAWRKERGYIFVFGINEQGESTEITVDGNTKSVSMKQFTKKGSNLPFVTIYWNKDGDAASAYKNRRQFCGREGSMLVSPDSGISDKDLRVADVFMRSVDSVVGSYVGGGAAAADGPSGSFVTTGRDFDRFEVETATQRISVGLTRSSQEASVQTNVMLRLVGADGRELSASPVNWAAGETVKYVEVDVAPFTGAPKTKNALSRNAAEASAAAPVETASKTAVLCLSNGGSTVASNLVYLVATKPNAASNPDFSGCAEFGRWTMDFAAATQFVASAEGSAYTLVSVQGSLWCPDCADADRNFLDVADKYGTNVVCKWARERQVALVTVDIPNFSSTETPDAASPSLLSWASVRTSLARNTKGENPANSGADPILTNAFARSGASYLSRKGVSYADAERVRTNNWNFARLNTAEGGFHRPEDTNPLRTGVPIFVLLRKDGTVAARFTDFSRQGPLLADRENAQAYLDTVFSQMLAIADDTDLDVTEIENNYPTDAVRTMTVTTNGVAVSGRLSRVDAQDAILLDGAWFRGNGNVEVKLSGDLAGRTDPGLSLDFYKRDAEGGIRMLDSLASATFTNYLFRGVGDCYVMVRHTNLTDFVSYTLKATVTSLEPDSSRTDYLVQDGGKKVKVVLEKDVLYRVEGIDVEACAAAAIFRPTGAAGFYTALAGGEAELVLTGDRLTIQKWIPGTVGFAALEDETNVLRVDEAKCGTRGEGGLTNVVKLSRFHGLSGDVSVKVSVDPLLTDLPKSRYQLLDGSGKAVDELTVDWSDNGIADRTVTVVLFGDGVFDGFERRLVLTAGVVRSSTGEVTAENGIFVFELVNDDIWCVCQNIRVDSVYPIPSAEGVELKGELINRQNWPSGIKLTVDNDAKAIVASGSTKAKAGDFSAVFRITPKASTATFDGKDFLIKGRVIDPAEVGSDPDDPEKAYNASCVTARTWKNVPLTSTFVPAMTNAATYGLLNGVLKLTIAKGAGKMSAKYTSADGNVSFSSKNGVFLDEDLHAFTATLVASSKKFGNRTLTVDALPDGSVNVELLTVGSDGATNSYSGTVEGAPWSKANPATRWKGYYTVFFQPVLAETDDAVSETSAGESRPYLTLKMESASQVNNGTVKWAGMLPTGKSVSGSSALTVVDDEAWLPTFKKVSSDAFSGLLKIGADAQECKGDGGGAVFAPGYGSTGIWMLSCWRRVVKKSTALGGNTYYLPFGAIYDYKSDELDCCCERDYGLQATNMTFSAIAPAGFADSLKYGKLDCIGSEPVVTLNARVGMDSIELDDGRVSQVNASLKFKRKTGIVSGSFALPFRDKTVKAKYSGVVTIGFGNGCGCRDDALVLPFVNGSWYLSDKVADPSGTAVSVRRGGAVVLEVK